MRARGSPEPAARPATPTSTSSQLARRPKRPAGVAGSRSPSASSPASTPLTMLLTAAAVQTCRDALSEVNLVRQFTTFDRVET